MTRQKYNVTFPVSTVLKQREVLFSEGLHSFLRQPMIRKSHSMLSILHSLVSIGLGLSPAIWAWKRVSFRYFQRTMHFALFVKQPSLGKLRDMGMNGKWMNFEHKARRWLDLERILFWIFLFCFCVFYRRPAYEQVHHNKNVSQTRYKFSRCPQESFFWSLYEIQTWLWKSSMSLAFTINLICKTYFSSFYSFSSWCPVNGFLARWVMAALKIYPGDW